MERCRIMFVALVLIVPACDDCEASKWDEKYGEADAGKSRDRQDDCQLGAQAKYRICRRKGGDDDDGELDVGLNLKGISVEAKKKATDPSLREEHCLKLYRQRMETCDRQ